MVQACEKKTQNRKYIRADAEMMMDGSTNIETEGYCQKRHESLEDERTGTLTGRIGMVSARPTCPLR